MDATQMEKPKVIDFRPYQENREIISQTEATPNNTRREPTDELSNAIQDLIDRMREFKPLKTRG
jgi:hypothetical protein